MKNPPTESPSVRDIAWAAGVFEGEGWVGCSRGHVHISLAQKDAWLLDRLVALFGGTIWKHKQKPIAYWRISGARARGFAMTIFALLSPRRREQVKAALINERQHEESHGYVFVH